ncbi:hypothetical protein [Acetobacter cibinongensis]|uniref:Mor transcription activator domain-containing protein n=1 Tax=Acetobacter cibinongensis TaxID=146475 RepID=A0A1Z5YRN0_9PROT|nr:hypothetical protein [Acetobacter cibinongensis]OUI99540.1 hypothetical protein HK14_14185 [Acetobacter cibinongensis]
MQAPSSISWLVDAVGEDAALEFVEANAGKRLYIPNQANGSVLEEMHGSDVATAVCRYRGGEQYQVPMARNWRVAMLAKRGFNNNDIAARTGLTWGRVSCLLQNDAVERPRIRPVNPGQLDMFG